MCGLPAIHLLSRLSGTERTCCLDELCHPVQCTAVAQSFPRPGDSTLEPHRGFKPSYVKERRHARPGELASWTEDCPSSLRSKEFRAQIAEEAALP